MWAEDKAHGPGTLTTANTTVEGAWINGKLDKGGDKKLTKNMNPVKCSNHNKQFKLISI